MSEPLTLAERNALLARAAAIEKELYPPEGGPPEPSGPERVKLLDRYYQVLHEYGDRLPRIPFGRCPLTNQVLKRSIDPFGLDGPWWHKSRLMPVEEPAAPPTFKVLLGALDLHGREPAEVGGEVIPGPQIPFVVPRLLKLPGMCAVVYRLEPIANGDVVHAISYFSSDSLPDGELHQHWLRQDLWYPNDEGGTSWLTQNDRFDYALGPWLASGSLKWIAPGDPELRLRSGEEGCPYVGLEGDPHPQMLSGGTRYALAIPDGSPIDPFA